MLNCSTKFACCSRQSAVESSSARRAGRPHRHRHVSGDSRAARRPQVGRRHRRQLPIGGEQRERLLPHVAAATSRRHSAAPRRRRQRRHARLAGRVTPLSRGGAGTRRRHARLAERVAPLPRGGAGTHLRESGAGAPADALRTVFLRRADGLLRTGHPADRRQTTATQQRRRHQVSVVGTRQGRISLSRKYLDGTTYSTYSSTPSLHKAFPNHLIGGNNYLSLSPAHHIAFPPSALLTSTPRYISRPSP